MYSEVELYLKLASLDARLVTNSPASNPPSPVLKGV